MAYTKLVPLNYATVPESPTSFCFCSFPDPVISSNLLVLKVLNSADTKHMENANRDDNDREHGKPEGFGNPGGGINLEELDTIRGAAEREVLAETGLKVKAGYAPLIEQPQLIISDKRTGKRIGKPILYEKGHEHSITIDVRNQIALKNPIYVFDGKVEWDGSRLQKLFHRIKDVNGLTEEFTQNNGMYILFDEDLTEETMASLEIEEARLNEETGTREIKGLGIFPLPMLMNMLDTKNCWFEELYFYYTHLMRDREIAIKLGLLPQPISV